jgi:hydroxymethylbilane synthase
MPLRLGTRGSALARWQAEFVSARLQALGMAVELVPIATAGDRSREPISAMGSPGAFTKEIQRALIDGRVDLAVHSLKDMPTAAVEGLLVAAIPERASPSDALVAAASSSLMTLPQGATVGVGSPRRRAQLLRVRPDLRLIDIRGNVDTRLRKLDAGEGDALVLAEAGLSRLGLAARITEILLFDVMLPAPGQGALAVEVRADDAKTIEAVAALDHPPSRAEITAERTLLAALGGGCLAPVAALGRVEYGRLTLAARALSPDGRRMFESAASADAAEAESLGRRLAEKLLSQGAAELLLPSPAMREMGRG